MKRHNEKNCVQCFEVDRPREREKIDCEHTCTQNFSPTIQTEVRSHSFAYVLDVEIVVHSFDLSGSVF